MEFHFRKAMISLLQAWRQLIMAKVFVGAAGLLQLYLEDDASLWKEPLDYQQGRVAYQDFMSCYNAVDAA